MIVNVTQKHIDEGIRCKCDSCPVALALEDDTGVKWWVGCYSFRRGLANLSMPVLVDLWIQNFDAGRPVVPFSFEFPWKEA